MSLPRTERFTNTDGTTLQAHNPNWIRITQGAPDIDLNIHSNALAATSSMTWYCWNGDVPEDDQYIEFRVVERSGSGTFFLCTRIQSSSLPLNCYTAGFSDTAFYMGEYTDSYSENRGLYTTALAQAGDIVRFEAHNTSGSAILSLKLNGTEILTWTDGSSPFLSGRLGIGAQGENINFKIDDLKMGNLSGRGPFSVTLSSSGTVSTNGVTITPSPVTLATSSVAPTVIKGSLSIAPTSSATAVSTVAPTVVKSSLTIVPTVGTLVVSGIAPSVVHGSLSLTPIVSTLVVSSINPSVTQSSVTITPASATIALSKVDPTVVKGSLAITPAVVSTAVSKIDPRVVVGWQITIDLEEGNLSEFTSYGTDGGDLSVSASAGLAGTNYGIACLIDDTTNIYAYKDFASDTSGILRLRFYIDPNSISMSNGGSIGIVQLFRTASFGLLLGGVRFYYYTATGYRIDAYIDTDVPDAVGSELVTISDAPHLIELQITRSSGSAANNGTLRFWVDGVEKTGATGIDNYDRFSAFVRAEFGTWYIPANTSGTIYLDEIVINNTGNLIGPFAGSITATTHTPATLATSKVDPTVIAGSLSITPTPATLSVAKVDPTILQGSLALTPISAALVLAKVDPTVIVGDTNVTVTPNPVTIAVNSVAPTTIHGSLVLDGQNLLITDNFERASLGSNWTTLYGTLAIVNNSDLGASNTDAAGYWNADDFSNNQYSQAVIAEDFDDGPGVIIRASGGPTSSYYGITFSDSSNADFFKLVSDTYTNFYYPAVMVAAGDVIRIEASGTTIVVKKNGDVIASVVDDSLPTGQPGVNLYFCQTALESWEAGNLVQVSSPALALSTIDPAIIAGSLVITPSPASIITSKSDPVVVHGSITLSGPLLLTDSFTGTNGTRLTAYSSNWTKLTSDDPIIQNNAIVGGTFNADNYVYWNANTPSDSQYAQIKITGIDAGWDDIAPAVRISTTEITCWVIYHAQSYFELWKIVNNVGVWFQRVNIQQQVNDILRLEATGALITAKLNGDVIISVIDDEIKTGRVGINTFGNSGSRTADDWEAGNLSPVIPPALSLSTVSPTIIIGSLVITPTAGSLAVSKVDPTVAIGTGNVTVAPDPIAVAISGVSPTIILGSVTATPASVSCAVASVDPNVVHTSLTLTPTAGVLAVSKIDPHVIAGFTVTINLEEGNLSEFASTITDSGDLSVTATSALAGTNYGLQVVVDDQNVIYGQYDIGINDTSNIVRARLYIDPNGIYIPVNQLIFVLRVRDNNNNALGYIELAHNGTSHRLKPIIVNDTPSNVSGPITFITDAPHWIEVKWTRSSSSTASDGSMESWVDGVYQGATTGVDNYDQWANFSSIRLGATYISSGSTSGTFYLDELVFNNTGNYIGPFAGSIATTPATLSVTVQSIAPTVVHGSLTLQPSAATLATASIDPAVIYGSATATPQSATTAVSSVDPTVVLGSLSISAIVSLAVQSVDPAIIYGSATVQPTPSSIATTTVAPAIVLSSVTAIPTPVSTALSGVDPVVDISSGDVVVTPSISTLSAKVVAPTVVLGSMVVTSQPATFANSTVDPAVVHGSLTLSPTVGETVLTNAGPTVVNSSLSIAPSAIETIFAGVDPTVILSSVAAQPTSASTVLSKVDPGVVLGSIAVTPTVGTVSLFVVSPTTLYGSTTATPTPVTTTLSSVAPSVIHSSLTISPLAVSIVTASVDPTVATGPITVTPQSATVVVSKVDPIVLDGSGNIYYTPAPATLATTIVDPILVLGSITAAPSAISLAVSTQSGTVVYGSLTLTPDVDTVVVTSIDPTVLRGSITATGTVSFATSTVSPTVDLSSITVTPQPISVVTTSVAPTTLAGSLALTPVFVSHSLATVDPFVTITGGGQTIQPLPVDMVLSLFGPNVSLGSLALTPQAVAFSLGAIDPYIPPFLIWNDIYEVVLEIRCSYDASLEIRRSLEREHEISRSTQIDLVL